MTFNIEKYVILTYARWARDFQYYNELYHELKKPQEKINSNESREIKDDGFPIQLVESLLDEQYEKFQTNFQKIFLQMDSRIQVNDTLFEKFTVLRKTHLRATIWKRSGTEITLRGYLTDLSYLGKFIDNTVEEIKKQNFKIISIKNAINAKKKIMWKTEEQLCIILKLNKLGFLEIEMISCDLDLLIEKNEIYNLLNDLLSKLDPEDLKNT